MAGATYSHFPIMCIRCKSLSAEIADCCKLCHFRAMELAVSRGRRLTDTLEDSLESHFAENDIIDFEGLPLRRKSTGGIVPGDIYLVQRGDEEIQLLTVGRVVLGMVYPVEAYYPMQSSRCYVIEDI